MSTAHTSSQGFVLSKPFGSASDSKNFLRSINSSLVKRAYVQRLNRKQASERTPGLKGFNSCIFMLYSVVIYIPNAGSTDASVDLIWSLFREKHVQGGHQWLLFSDSSSRCSVFGNIVNFTHEGCISLKSTVLSLNSGLLFTCFVLKDAIRFSLNSTLLSNWMR